MWWRRTHRDRDLDEEIRIHLAMAERDLIDRGRSPEAAKNESKREFGNVAHVREAARATWVVTATDHLRQDVRYALRAFRRSPWFSLASIGALGLAIGLGTSLFTAFNTLFLATWPVHNPAGLAQFRIADVATYERLHGRTRTFADLTVIACRQCRLRFQESDVRAQVVSGNFFEVLGVSMAVGRAFTAADDGRNAAAPTAVLSHRFWRSAFNGDPEIVGKWITVQNHVSLQVIGVAAREFTGTTLDAPPSIWVPLGASASLGFEGQSGANVRVIGRLAEGVALQSAQAEVNVLLGPSSRTPETPGNAVRLQEARYLPWSQVEEFAALGVMTAAVLLILLLACANVGNLLLARAAARTGETATRLSLGASRGRLIRQHLTESMTLALVAALVGIALAFVLPPVVLREVGAASGRPIDLSVSFTPDPTVMLFACALASLTVLGFGLAPALLASRQDAMSAMRVQGMTQSARLGPRRLLLAIQVAASTMLLVSASLVARSVQYASEADLGFDIAEVSEARLDAPPWLSEAQRLSLASQFFGETLRLDHSAVAVWSQAFGYAAGAFVVLPDAPAVPSVQVPKYSVSPSFFTVMRIPLVLGRTVDASVPDGVVVSESLARRLWSDQSPLGRPVMIGPAVRRVVGVAADADLMGESLKREFREFRPAVYERFTEPSLAARVLVRRERKDLIDGLSLMAARVDVAATLSARPLTTARDERLGDTKVAGALAGAAGLAALGIATIGIAGVFGYVARQRRREIGIHVALGASPRTVLIGAFGSSIRAVAFGSVAGLIGAYLATPLLRGYVHPSLGGFDGATYAGVTALLTLTAIIATAIPARAATRVSPATVLRSD
jgi:predicted permease